MTSVEPVIVIEEADAILGTGTGRFHLHIPHFVLNSGERIAVVGPSGSGKTALIEVLGLLRRPDTVKRFVLWPRRSACGGNGGALDLASDVASLSNSRFVDRHARTRAQVVATIPQRGALMRWLRARENIAAHPALVGLPPDEIADRIQTVAARLGIEAVLDRRPGNLSGGEQQRVALARALVAAPDVILADEPTAALDATRKHEVLQLLEETASESGIAVIVATHDVGLVDAAGFTLIEAMPAPEGSSTGGATFERQGSQSPDLAPHAALEGAG